jgi:hypothetical protein
VKISWSGPTSPLARASRCPLLVYVDDATGDLMALRFARSESAFDYFASTRIYLTCHGRPVAFTSDKHAIFRVTREHAAGAFNGVTQFGRALAEAGNACLPEVRNQPPGHALQLSRRRTCVSRSSSPRRDPLARSWPDDEPLRPWPRARMRYSRVWRIGYSRRDHRPKTILL